MGGFDIDNSAKNDTRNPHTDCESSETTNNEHDTVTLEDLEADLVKEADAKALILKKLLDTGNHTNTASLEQCLDAMLQFPNFSGFVSDGLTGFAKTHHLSRMQALYVKLVSDLTYANRTVVDRSGMRFESRYCISDFLLDVFQGERVEVIHVYYVDSDMRVIGHFMQRGGRKSLEVDTAEICKHRPYSTKCGVYIARNDIKNCCCPSQTDILNMERIRHLLKPFHIVLLDMFIVSDDSVYSTATFKFYTR